MFQLRPKLERLLQLQKINSDSLILRLFLWSPVFLYAGLIFYLSGLSVLPVSVDIPFLDKLEHLFEYAIFGILLIRALYNSGFKLSRQSAVAWAVIIAFIYAISDEMHQVFVPGRSADFFDALFDLLGASSAVFIYKIKILDLKK